MCGSVAVGVPCMMVSSEMPASGYGKQAHKYSNIWGGWQQAALEQHKHGLGDNNCNNSKKDMVNQQSTGSQYGDNGSSGNAASALGQGIGNWKEI